MVKRLYQLSCVILVWCLSTDLHSAGISCYLLETVAEDTEKLIGFGSSHIFRDRTLSIEMW